MQSLSQQEGKSRGHLCDWYIKNSGSFYFGKQQPKERYKRLTCWRLHHPAQAMVYDFDTKDTKRKFVPRRKIGKLNEYSETSDFTSNAIKDSKGSQVGTSAKG